MVIGKEIMSAGARLGRWPPAGEQVPPKTPNLMPAGPLDATALAAACAAVADAVPDGTCVDAALIAWLLEMLEDEAMRRLDALVAAGHLVSATGLVRALESSSNRKA